MAASPDLVAATDRGRLRERNEDAVAVDSRLGVGVLADGMGGLRDGHLASREVVAAILAALRGADREGPGPLDATALQRAVVAANAHLLEFARRGPGVGLMGTTAVVVSVAPAGRCAIAHVGDSRAYCLRAQQLHPLTRDHSVVQEQVERGLLSADEARRAPNRNVITRAVGLEAGIEVETVELRIGAGDLLLLCSDGLWDMLEDGRIAEILAAAGGGTGDLEVCAQRLIAAANAAGGRDNVSVVLARAPDLEPRA